MMVVSVVGFLFLLITIISFYNSKFFKFMVSSKRNMKTWVSPFECGFMSHSMKVKSFSSGLFLLLVFFVIFDLEVSLLLKSAYQLKEYDKMTYYLFFMFLMGVGFLLEVFCGFIRWSK